MLARSARFLHLSGDELHADKIPDDATLPAQDNNQLRALCDLTLRELVDAIKVAVEKKKEAAAKPSAAKRRKRSVEL